MPSLCRRWIETVGPSADDLPFLVFEGGDYAFDQWLARPGRPFAEKKCALGKVLTHPLDRPLEGLTTVLQILEALADLHEFDRKIGDLAPNRIFWFSSEDTWKLLDLCASATRRRERPPSEWPEAKHAAPETVLSGKWQEATAALGCASDMWSFGAMILEVILPGTLDTHRLRDAADVPFLQDTTCAIQTLVPTPIGALPSPGRSPSASRTSPASTPTPCCETCCRSIPSRDAPRLRPFAAPSSKRQTIRAEAAFRRTRSVRSVALAVLRASLQIRSLLRSSKDPDDRTSSQSSSRTAPRTSVVVEYFRRRSNSSDPFHLRPGKEAYVTSDDDLPHHPVYLLRAGQNFRLRVRPESDDATAASPSPRVKTVYARVDEGEYIALDTVTTVGERKKVEVVALVEPARLQSPRLLTPTPSDDDLAEKYVKLDVVIDAALVGDAERVDDRQHVIYLKILPRTGSLRKHRFQEERDDAE